MLSLTENIERISLNFDLLGCNFTIDDVVETFQYLVDLLF